MFVVKGKSGKVIGRYPTREAAARRIAQLKAGARRLAPYKFGRGTQRSPSEVDEQAADELRLYLDNEADLYRRKMSSFIPNVRRKIEQGKYDPALAPKLWIYLVDDAAKKYVKEMGGSFDVATRRAVAAQLAKDELQMLMNGEYGPPPALKQKKGRLAHSPGYAPPGVVKLRRFNRAQLIKALNLSPEGRGRGQKYDFTTDEYRKRIAYGIGPKERRARELLLGAA